jgi:hypothetical protein
MPIWIPLYLRETCKSGNINDPVKFREELEKIADELSKGTFPYRK